MPIESPEPRLWRASDEEAVELCREWMIYLGAADAVVAQGEARKVCDLYSSRFLAWVDNRRQNLDVDVVQTAAQVAAMDGRYPMIFVPGGIFPDAQYLADATGVALLRFDSVGGDLDGASAIGRRLRAHGLAEIVT